jgi:hypothetical protein
MGTAGSRRLVSNTTLLTLYFRKVVVVVAPHALGARATALRFFARSLNQLPFSSAPTRIRRPRSPAFAGSLHVGPTLQSTIRNIRRCHTACAVAGMTKTSTGPARFHAYDLSLQLVTAVRLASACGAPSVTSLIRAVVLRSALRCHLREGSAYLAGSPSRR